MFDIRVAVVVLLHIIALAVLPSGFRWILATAFPFAALLNFLKPDDRPATTPYVLGLVGVTSALGILYRIVYVFSADSPGPEGATLYGLALWALGLAGATYSGYLVYVIRFIFFERTGVIFAPRERAQDAFAKIKRQH